jgi:spore germination cell wall hydrolase CwlJ-like protein
MSEPLFAEENFAVATIWQEARGEIHEGKVAVGEVIRTRMAKKVFSDGTILGTVLAPFQFAGWNPRDPNRLPALRLKKDDPAVADCEKAWAESATSSLTAGATHYFNPRIVRPAWADTMQLVATVGHHAFYAEAVESA